MGKTILIVDDSMMVRRQVGQVLSDSGYEVLQAGDGLEGLDKLASAPDTALVICDVNMPRMNGVEFLQEKKLRNNVVPVVMLTTEDQEEMIQKAKALGCKGWLLKPFKPASIVAAVAKLTA